MTPRRNANAWWAISQFGGPGAEQNGHQYFYLEQKLGNDFGENNVVVPNGIRRDLFERYDTSANPLDPDSQLLVERFAKELIPPAIKYSAVFSLFWYDHVNPPPYLKSLVVRQKSVDVKLPGESAASGGYFVTAYQARWQNFASQLTAHDSQSALFTSSRKLKRDVLTQPINKRLDLELILAFSEAIKSPVRQTGGYDSESEFKLQLKVLPRQKNSWVVIGTGNTPSA